MSFQLISSGYCAAGSGTGCFGQTPEVFPSGCGWGLIRSSAGGGLHRGCEMLPLKAGGVVLGALFVMLCGAVPRAAAVGSGVTATSQTRWLVGWQHPNFVCGASGRPLFPPCRQGEGHLSNAFFDRKGALGLLFCSALN